jgi:hypothetical protein
MPYQVLKPNFIRTGEVTPTGQPYYRVEWTVVGQAKDMEDAKRQFGGTPVLQRV